MIEDRFVQMLLEAAAGSVADERDLELARAAASWALTHNWQPVPGTFSAVEGFLIPGEGMDRWIANRGTEPRLVIQVRLDGGEWCQHVSWPVDSLGHALDLLAAEQLIPARFSTIGRRAVLDHATVLDRAGDILGDLAREGFYATRDRETELIMEGRISGLHEAALSARRFAHSELAALS